MTHNSMEFYRIFQRFRSSIKRRSCASQHLRQHNTREQIQVISKAAMFLRKLLLKQKQEKLISSVNSYKFLK